MFDVAIVGLGPAGRALASACASAGLQVLAVDPHPDAVWAPTFGMWADELGDLPTTVVRARVDHPEIRGRATHDLTRTYVILDNPALQAALPLTGVEIERSRLDDDDVKALSGRARVVVDARGARPDGRVRDDLTPHQTAYGIVLPSALAAPALGHAEGFLMDFTPARARRLRPGSLLEGSDAASCLRLPPYEAERDYCVDLGRLGQLGGGVTRWVLRETTAPDQLRHNDPPAGRWCRRRG